LVDGQRPLALEAAHADERLLEVVEAIQAFARLEFTTTAGISPAGDIVDAIAAGVNMLGEELAAFRLEVEERAGALSVANAELARRALYDPLTGLANRALFLDRLCQTLDEREPTAASVAVLAIDIDGFKEVNDTMGRDAGDRMLVEIARRLQRTRGPRYSIARTGGDEFFALIADTTPVKAQALARTLAARLREPFRLTPEVVRVTASIGIAIASAEDDPEELMRKAGIALSTTKSVWNRVPVVFVPGMQAPIAERLQLTSALRRAVERHELTLAYQPIVDLTTQEIKGFEALSRWVDPALGAVPPSSFIPLAEEIGIMPALGAWVLETACAEAAGWSPLNGEPPYLSVNLAAVELRDVGLPGRVAGVLRATGLPAGSLLLEVTESQLVEHAAQAAAILGELRALGVRIAIDDFGTGYSSLSYLRHLPVDVVKIDRSFILGIGEDAEVWKFAQSVVRLVKGLGLVTVVEGIEDAAQGAHARALGCDNAQGYYFGRPQDAASVRRLIGEPRTPVSAVRVTS
jgi:diguanylate cyclase (GGDEF)-like protein